MNPELWEYCMRYRASIFVPALKNGKWGSHSLSEVSFEKAVELIAEWDLKGIFPARLLTQETKVK